MSLKSALFEMKEMLLEQEVGQLEEEIILELEEKNRLSKGTLVFYFNNLMIVNMNNSEYATQTLDESKKVNRKWTKNEIEFMFHYIKERQEEGALNITVLLEEVAQLLTRGYQSVNYKYYALIKARDKKVAPNKSAYHFTTITENEVPVLATEVLSEGTQAKLDVTTNEDDLLDILSGLITNVQKLPELNLNELLRSLFHLTNMALQNQDSARQVESMKSQINLEKESLQAKLLNKEKQLSQEKKRNDELQLEVAKLAKEITAYNQLGDAAKIQNLKSHTQRLNYLIDNFGVVLQVRS